MWQHNEILKQQGSSILFFLHKEQRPPFKIIHFYLAALISEQEG